SQPPGSVCHHSPSPRAAGRGGRGVRGHDHHRLLRHHPTPPQSASCHPPTSSPLPLGEGPGVRAANARTIFITRLLPPNHPDPCVSTPPLRAQRGEGAGG